MRRVDRRVRHLPDLPVRRGVTPQDNAIDPDKFVADLERRDIIIKISES